MFTGLIEEVGRVVSICTANTGTTLQISALRIARGLPIGASVAVNGCCLTVSARHRGKLTFDLLQETLDRTNLEAVQAGSTVNLEPALAADGRIGGHFLQGHIDCVSTILRLEKTGADFRLEIELPKQFVQYVVPKGSIAVDGISLTIAEVRRTSFVVWIIPHTKKHTNLDRARPGQLVNLEFDILAKYVERMVGKG
jgi:riboflavin synthase